jgi:hypothetical protein
MLTKRYFHARTVCTCALEIDEPTKNSTLSLKIRKTGERISDVAAIQARARSLNSRVMERLAAPSKKPMNSFEMLLNQTKPNSCRSLFVPV